MQKVDIDPTGAKLHPGNCQGNGNHPDFEICRDNCNWFLLCFPQYNRKEFSNDRQNIQ